MWKDEERAKQYRENVKSMNEEDWDYAKRVKAVLRISDYCIFVHVKKKCGSSSVGRASASQAEGRGFESRLPLLINGYLHIL